MIKKHYNTVCEDVERRRTCWRICSVSHHMLLHRLDRETSPPNFTKGPQTTPQPRAMLQWDVSTFKYFQPGVLLVWNIICSNTCSSPKGVILPVSLGICNLDMLIWPDGLCKYENLLQVAILDGCKACCHHCLSSEGGLMVI